jgi:hypothetical protein
MIAAIGFSPPKIDANWVMAIATTREGNMKGTEIKALRVEANLKDRL